MVRLYPTPSDSLVDSAGRPCFLGDSEMTLAEFERRLRDAGREGRAYRIGKRMRQARPDDVFTFVTVDDIVDLWPLLRRDLGRQREFWAWLLEFWGCSLEPAQ